MCYEKFRRNYQTIKKEKKLSQQLAEQVRVSNGIISAWENNINEPKSKLYKKLALIFSVSADYLLGLENEYGVKLIPKINR
ncbi:MAG: helix-turn-helix domain-containing protein [Christensenellaceae bacterium]